MRSEDEIVLDEMRMIITSIRDIQLADHALLIEHDKILVRGNGAPSLQEVVRTLSESLTAFMQSYKVERDEIRIKKQEEEKERKDEARWWKRTIIGFGLPITIAFVGQFIVFWVKVAPIISNFDNIWRNVK